MTLSPYLGEDSLIPFANYIAQGRGLFILAKRSNKGSSDFQDREIQQGGSHMPLYYAVASLAQVLADRHPVGMHGYSSVGIIVGATFPTQANELRIIYAALLPAECI
jgi:orotidine-5'-phosphate decarboxylase